MSEFSHAPTESPERRAASLAASRTSGRTPFTCQGTYLMLTPRLGFGQVGIFDRLGALPSRTEFAQIVRSLRSGLSPDYGKERVNTCAIWGRYFLSSGREPRHVARTRTERGRKFICLRVVPHLEDPDRNRNVVASAGAVDHVLEQEPLALRFRNAAAELPAHQSVHLGVFLIGRCTRKSKPLRSRAAMWACK